MSIKYGTIAVGKIIDENVKSYSVQMQGITFQLNKSEGHHEIGEEVEGFIYENQQHKKKMTTHIPSVTQERYGWGEVVRSRHDLGVFVNIGLEDKDIVVSMDDLPQEFAFWPKKGDKLLISLKIDRKDRLWGELADEEVIEELTRPLSKNFIQSKKWKNWKIKATVYLAQPIGMKLITDDNHLAFIHPSETQETLRLGQQVKGRVIGIGKNRNYNLSLKPLSYQQIDENSEMLLANLKYAPNKFLPFNDKSDPDVIRGTFGLSKAQFKRALGHLLKEDKVVQTSEGIFLVEEDES